MGCELDRIAESVVLQGVPSGEPVLLVAVNGRTALAAAIVGEPLERADAVLVPELTGLAIGGVAPPARRVAPRAFFDPALERFQNAWAAAGTPRPFFEIEPAWLHEPARATPADAAFGPM